VLEEAKRCGCRQAVICRQLGLALRTVQNWRNKGLVDGRKGAPKRVSNKLSETERANVLKTACDPRFANLTPHALVPILAENEVYLASESTMYRIFRQEKLVKPKKRRTSARRQAVEIKADKPNQVWSWDITYIKTIIRGCYFYLYLILDVFSRYIVGWEIRKTEDAVAASTLVASTCQEHGIERDTLTLHADNGGPMKNGTMFATLQNLGVADSFSRPHVSNDNAFSEALFKTLKYVAGYPVRFETIEQAIEWVTRFVAWYNTEHRHSGISYVTPEQRYRGRDVEILMKRKAVYDAARLKHPERWSRHTRSWDRIETVWLKKPNHKEKCA
jgi:putative transposase